MQREQRHPFSLVAACLTITSVAQAASVGSGALGFGIQYRIVGGKPVDQAIGWVASIRATVQGKVSNYCGGSLVAPEWVLTAAHCVDTRYLKQDKVWIGGRDVEDESQYEIIGVERWVCHPQYDQTNGVDNDVCLIKLASPSTRPIMQLNDDPARNAPDTNAKVTGFGATTDDARGPKATELMEADVPIVSDGLCEKSYGARYNSQTMLCAGYQEGGHDACYGDSGSALFTDDGVQVGIVSWGSGCGAPSLYTIYTRVSEYKRWIDSVIGTSVEAKALTSDTEAQPTETAEAAPAGDVPADPNMETPSDAPIETATAAQTTNHVQGDPETAAADWNIPGASTVAAGATVAMETAPAHVSGETMPANALNLNSNSNVAKPLADMDESWPEPTAIYPEPVSDGSAETNKTLELVKSLGLVEVNTKSGFVDRSGGESVDGGDGGTAEGTQGEDGGDAGEAGAEGEGEGDGEVDGEETPVEEKVKVMEQPDVCEESCLLFVGTAILRNMSAIYRVRPKEMIGHQIGKYPIRIINPVTVNAVYEGPKNTTLRLRKRAGGHNDDIHIATAKSDGSGPMSLTATLTPGFYAWDIYAPPRTAGPFLAWIQKVDMSKQRPPKPQPTPTAQSDGRSAS